MLSLVPLWRANGAHLQTAPDSAPMAQPALPSPTLSPGPAAPPAPILYNPPFTGDPRLPQSHSAPLLPGAGSVN